VTFNCPNCGGGLTLRMPQHTLAIACGSCGAVIDAQDPNHALIAQYESRLAHKPAPAIPLGARGTFGDETYECVGFLVRASQIEGTWYRWREYLVFSPFRGYRWLVESEGHWLFTKPCLGIPERITRRGTASFGGRVYRKFQEAQAVVDFVLGEFNWKVKRGDTVTGTDYVAPPYLLSREESENEVTWSIAQYMEPSAIAAAFRLGRPLPEPRGVAPAQPSPVGASVGRVRRVAAILGALAIAVHLLGHASAANRVVHEETFAFAKDDAERARVSQPFAIGSGSSNVVVHVATDLANQWAYFRLALVDEASGRALETGKEIEFYSGWDAESGGWSEGRQDEQVRFGSVPGGEWVLRIEPDTPAEKLAASVEVRRDVPHGVGILGLALLLLALPFVYVEVRHRRFEEARWAESDEPPVASAAGIAGLGGLVLLFLLLFAIGGW
jgi:hypothetical protein